MLPVVFGVIAWAVALVFLALSYEQLAAAGTTWWYGACAVGLISGLLGIVYIRYRRRREGGFAK